MYKEHRYMSAFIAVAIYVIVFFFNLDYEDVASEGITIVSIVLAIYMTSISNLINSDLMNNMKIKQDEKLAHKSQLGVLRGYFNVAVGVSVSNIVIGISIILMKELQFQTCLVYKLLSGLGFSLLCLNIYMMMLVYRFMTNRQLWGK